MIDEEEFLEVIEEWRRYWGNQTQNSKDDYDNYRRRASGIDANMKYHLAEMLRDKVKEKVLTLFDKIKHGDEAHQAWLKKTLDEHFK